MRRIGFITVTALALASLPAAALLSAPEACAVPRRLPEAEVGWVEEVAEFDPGEEAGNRSERRMQQKMGKQRCRRL